MVRSHDGMHHEETTRRYQLICRSHNPMEKQQPAKCESLVRILLFITQPM
jgi:hypothetical protein